MLDQQLKREIPRDLTISEAVNAALERYLRGAAGAVGPPAVPKTEQPPPVLRKHDKWHQMLDAILESGHRIAIDAVTENLVAFDRLVKVDTPNGAPAQGDPAKGVTAAPAGQRAKRKVG